MDSLFPPRSWDGVDDVVIVGGGLAGLFCALKLAPRPVTIVTSTPIGGGASALAQGGIPAAIGAGDSVEQHVADTLAAGAGLVDERVALGMAREAAARVHDLVGYGVLFDRDEGGVLRLSREAAHSRHRIVRARGDMAGAIVMTALALAVRRSPAIRALEGHLAEQLRTEGPFVTGLVVRDRRGGLSDRLLVPTRAIVLASGGIGQLYEVTTNPPDARGEGLAMAARAGALIANPEFVQFHPTAIDTHRDPAPLASEALRGEGAVIVDRSGHRFLLDEHPDGELAPRDVVARAVHEARISGRGAFLDCRKAIGDSFAERFPAAYAACVAAGIDPATRPIPIAPAAHYHMGGVHVDSSGRTTLDGLWACGEVASTGVHGANRLAANALLEALVFAARVAEDIQGQLPRHKGARWAETPAAEAPSEPEHHDEAIRTLRATMSHHVGVVRDEAGLSEALATIDRLSARVHDPRVRNALTAAKMVAAAALARKESRGSHYRSDFPESEGSRGARTFLTLVKAEATAKAARKAVSEGM